MWHDYCALEYTLRNQGDEDEDEGSTLKGRKAERGFGLFSEVNEGKYNAICSRVTLEIGVHDWGIVPARRLGDQIHG